MQGISINVGEVDLGHCLFNQRVNGQRAEARLGDRHITVLLLYRVGRLRNGKFAIVKSI